MYIKNEKGNNALHYAASIGYLKGVRLLLKKDSELALESNSEGLLPIHIACEEGHIDVVKEFLEQEWLDPNELLSKSSQNILHIAAKYGKDNVVNYILRNKNLGILLNQKDRKGNTPLHLAAKSLHPKTVLFLTQDKRLQVEVANNQKLTPHDVLVLRLKIPYTVREQSWRRQPPQVEWYKDRINTLLLVSILVATVTFAAGFTVPWWY
ncbi:Protein ACCELERATED CELL DEATH 6 [Quillaja saponaria]|uniref:Protein ACCELERATED CELL DEATH 6 n=1 Tax=Quillaja saponaria TaxID=32244 RepID=A0AAD7QH93_QUISA|nr:Protein ACCELERATED CELL DEATH 6 [Quillaja saponaria]